MTSRARPIAEPDDAIAAQRHGGLHDLVRERVDHAAAAQQPIGVDGAAGSADEFAEILHRPAEETTARMP
jgi:orotidine-5'-phosphate decarboxylase